MTHQSQLITVADKVLSEIFTLTSAFIVFSRSKIIKAAGQAQQQHNILVVMTTEQ